MTDAGSAQVREVRLGLVLNGGVSLAIWMGGVTQELDAARRVPAGSSTGTAELYEELLYKILRQEVRVDVIAGSSAGGINGALLGAAIATGQRVPDLRKTWIDVGDFAKLLRRPSERDPPSLMQGDEILLDEVRDKLAGLTGSGELPPHALCLYIAATSLRGRTNSYSDTTGRRFTEDDPRHMFAFEHPQYQLPLSAGARRRRDRQTVPEWPAREAGPTVMTDQALWMSRLAEAMRASSSFPLAFEASGPLGPKRDWFVDAGIYDNQPFGPVLDRIGVLPASKELVKRVVGYVVPYVNEPLTEPGTVNEDFPTAMDTVRPVGLPNKLAALQSLDRVTADHEAQRADAQQLDVVAALLASQDGDWLEASAETLIGAYRATRWRASMELFSRWSTPGFVPGSGRAGQDPTIAVREIIAPDSGGQAQPLLVNAPWIPDAAAWSSADDEWRWGLDPAERVATWALLLLRDALKAEPGSSKLGAARAHASRLVWHVRALKQQLSENVAWPSVEGAELKVRASHAYDELVAPVGLGIPALTWLRWQFVRLNHLIEDASDLPGVRRLLHVEVVSNALRIAEDAAPFPFDFVFMSAGTENSLGHPLRSPDKLAGMELAHFSGFLKRSWRANDWLWGRLDGVEHVLRATLDIAYLKKLCATHPEVVDHLAAFAFGVTQRGEDEIALAVLEARWVEHRVERPLDEELSETLDALPAVEQFKAVLGALVDAPAPPDRRLAALGEELRADSGLWLELCRAQIAARIQLEVLQGELPVVAEAASEDLARGARQTSHGALWLRRFRDEEARAARLGCEEGVSGELGHEQRVALFREMSIGKEEGVADELLSRAGLEIAAQALAVTASMLSGARGGLPRALRPALVVVRGAASALSIAVRLVTSLGAGGAAVLAVVAGLAFWAFSSSDTLVGTIAPLLAMLAVLLLSAAVLRVTAAMTSTRERWKSLLASLLVAAVLAALGLLALGVAGDPIRDWMSEHTSDFVTSVVGWLATIAAACALGVAGLTAAPTPEGAQGAGGLMSKIWSRIVRSPRPLVNLLRGLVALAAISTGAGFVHERFRSGCLDRASRADGMQSTCIVTEQRGIVVVVLLLVTISFAVLLVDGAPRIRRRR